MRLSLILPFLVLPVAPFTATAADIDATSSIARVIVFPSGAEVTRSAAIDLPTGAHTIILQDLPERLIDSSLRVEGEGGFQLGSIDSKKIYVNVTEGEDRLDDSQRKQLEDEIEKLQDEKARLQAIIRTAQTQKRLMERLVDLPGSDPVKPVGGGSGARYSADNWGAMFDLIGQRISIADDRIHQTRLQVRARDKAIEKLKKRLSQQPLKKERQTEVRIAVAADAAVKGRLKLKYQVREAAWKPFYDARLSTGEDGKAPTMKLERRGGIRQWSGEDWNKVKLSLSTTSPQKGAQAPVLHPQKVDILKPRPRPVGRSMMKRSMDFNTGRRAMAPQMESLEDQVEVAAAAAPGKVRAAREIRANVRNYAFQAVFDIPGAVTIPATGDEKKVAISLEAVKPALKVQTVPKLNQNAYLYAEFEHGKGATPLLPGKVALYRDGTYTGDGHLPLVAAGDKHALGFGVDDAVKVKRAELKRSKGETGLISTSNIDKRSYRIRVSNLHATAIDVVVIDQIPYSVNDKVEVKLASGSTKPSRSNVEDRRGILAWDFKLAAGKEREIRLDYSITWPSGKQLTGNSGR